MVDEIDHIQELTLLENEGLARGIAARAVIPAGEPGECLNCGEESKRLVRGNCARCRDELRLP